MTKLRAMTLSAVLLVAGLVAIPAIPSDAATWGEARYVSNVNGTWWGTVDDIDAADGGRNDGMCVSLWTINSRLQKVRQIARSCGPAASGGASAGGWRTSYGVRMYRDDGRYQTIVWPR